MIGQQSGVASLCARSILSFPAGGAGADTGTEPPKGSGKRAAIDEPGGTGDDSWSAVSTSYFKNESVREIDQLQQVMFCSCLNVFSFQHSLRWQWR